MIMINRYYTIFNTLETNSRGLNITSRRILVTRAKGYGVGEIKTSVTPHESSLYLWSTHQNEGYNIPELIICVLCK